MNIFKYSISSISIIILCFGCQFQLSEVPPDAQSYASMVIEYDWMDGYDLRNEAVGDEQFSFVNVSNSFEDVGMEFYQYPDEDELLESYATFDPGYPSPYFPSNDVLLRDFAHQFDTDSLRWHLLAVDGYEDNPHPNDGTINALGISTEYTPNTVPTPHYKRFSYIFVQDISDYFSGNYTYNRIPGFITTVMHELGHQRAGLTHQQTYPQYHDASFACVMGYFSGVTSDPLFCKEITDQVQESSCLTNLEDNYGNF